VAAVVESPHATPIAQQCEVDRNAVTTRHTKNAKRSDPPAWSLGPAGGSLLGRPKLRLQFVPSAELDFSPREGVDVAPPSRDLKQREHADARSAW
jgi:hypothetical protein